MKDYIKHNREAWNKKVPIHLASAFYDNTSFLEGRSSLNEIELDLLGNVKGKSILHLQCHFGQDTPIFSFQDHNPPRCRWGGRSGPGS